MFGNRKYSSIDFIDIFSIRHSPSEHGSALIIDFVDVSSAQQSANEFDSVFAYSKHSNIQVFNYDKKVFQKEKLDAIKVFENE